MRENHFRMFFELVQTTLDFTLDGYVLDPSPVTDVRCCQKLNRSTRLRCQMLAWKRVKGSGEGSHVAYVLRRK